MSRLVIVGGGASGVLTAAAASRLDVLDDVVIVERSERTGPGLAYGSAAPHHRLNSPAGRMGVDPADPGGFVRWSAGTAEPQDAAEFSPRRLYGEYLESVAGALPRVRVHRGDAIDLVTTDAAAQVRLADGATIAADAVVLALGNPPPSGRAAARSGSATIADPWAPGALDGVHGRVLLVGTGLTMVDVATALARADPATRLTATSRHLLLPRVHPATPQTPGPGIADARPRSVGELVRAFQQRLRAAEATGAAWQAEVDGVRPQINALWSALPHRDRARFVEHVSRKWEVHRHRMSPVVGAELQALLDDGRLVLAAPSGEYDAVVDCTGPRSFATPGWSPLVDALLDAGVARPDALGIGLDVDDLGRLRDAGGSVSERVLVVGPARRGTQWESTAIPEIRAHANEVASLASELVTAAATAR